MSGRWAGCQLGPVVDHRDPADVDPAVAPVRALPVEHGDEIAAADHPVVGVEVGVHEAGRADIGHRRPQPGVQGAARRDPRRFGRLVQQLPPVVDDGRERRRRPPGRGRRRGVDAGQHPHGLGEHGAGRRGRAALGEHVAGRSARHAVDDEVRGAEPRPCSPLHRSRGAGTPCSASAVSSGACRCTSVAALRRAPSGGMRSTKRSGRRCRRCRRCRRRRRRRTPR